MAVFCELESPLQGAVEVDESYFGAHRVRGKCGRGAYGKTIVFGLLKRQGQGLYRNRASLLQNHAARYYPFVYP